MARFYKTPAFLTWLFRGVLWRKDPKEKIIYLTFDDGPIPDVTAFVLDQLQAFNAKATFFCVGDNVRRYPAIALKIKTQGHVLANHTFYHVKAWESAPALYLSEVQQCQEILEKTVGKKEGRKLFRPPHGQLTWRLLRMLKSEFQPVMWSCLSYDFDATVAPEECLRCTIAATGPGAIVVFHDSLKAERNLRFVLPRLLAHFANLGYSFKSL